MRKIMYMIMLIAMLVYLILGLIAIPFQAILSVLDYIQKQLDILINKLNTK